LKISARSENVWKSANKHCILFSRAAKSFGIANESIVFCSAKTFGTQQQHKLRTNALCFVQPRSERFWNLPTKATQTHCILFCGAAKFFGIYKQKQPKFVFVQPRRGDFGL
jgi:hypothetical protein